MKRRRAEESADGLALMTSSVTSSQSADGLSQAVARNQQRFALALKIQQMLFALITSRKIQSRAIVDPVARFIQSTRYDGSSRELQYYASSRKDPDARKADVAKHCNQAQRVLTAAGCGIGSVHEVVRSNLLVVPSEVEEGEM
ncbi:hypothetical protein F511_12489 [Dorcoceras hygrometricum]|uniref:Uncharacterized protein n=1 Tax=Dorcoceras hygrometricum TaxID=472368 RepID=A0A2Z7C1B8_9LAMI|nr:hypothetical protein F511_12489 [Dorcoceras hygrometricum]